MFRQAIKSDLPIIKEWIYERAVDLKKKELSQWAFYLNKENTAILNHDFEQGHLYVFLDQQQELQGALVLMEGDQWDFDLWPDHTDVDAYYLHRVIVPITKKGQHIGSQLVTYAKEQAQATNKILRLDCARFSPFLRPFYEKHGFHLAKILEEFYLFEWKPVK
ncbi:GNAT family N-acetyltransferase [Alkalihalobacillus pseudalcaliphilus]|uniref:GNAT family N-acetyltransferase n=1 Tax=Alkalihalobacillus pseudalcaliphilus TaxID=79884 RepID=UPI00064D8B3B|nr:GNAT family N-acetyltransferase [Alkalihalobacillus pseudalcaliphilus]KMK74712.1 hypothetical protein AB990_19700 [Alkalihalobacillus pseudalcaliphilus]